MMTLELATELASILWGLIGIGVLIGVLVAYINPEVTEAYFGNPPTLLFGILIGAVVVAVFVSFLGGTAGASPIWPWG